MKRRTFLKGISGVGAALSFPLSGRAGEPVDAAGVLVNDIHSQLNPTYVRNIVRPVSAGELARGVEAGRAGGQGISVAGGRHAMGGQQFGEGTVHIDTRSMNRVLDFDSSRGIIRVESGIQWPELIEYLNSAETASGKAWSIIQKQTGADRLCIGGALGANAHGRGLRFKPFIADVESFELVDARGETITCSRDENSELFSLAIGGYGLFGVMATVDLRLMQRTRLRRVVEIIDIPELVAAFEKRIAAGYLYGDCQFSIDSASPDFLVKGVFSCYEPIGEGEEPGAQKRLQESDWRKLYVLAHDDPQKVFDVYSSYYLSTSGQVYWSDTHQLSTYIDDYHGVVDATLGSKFPGSEMITEVYVPRNDLPKLLADLAQDFRHNEVKVIYGTIRLIEKDDESFLPWAKQSYACIVMNLHVAHRPQAIAKAANDFRRIIDRAIVYGGSYFLTYHRWASREQIDACYPGMPDFLGMKAKYDPTGVFQSDWYRGLVRMYG